MYRAASGLWYQTDANDGAIKARAAGIALQAAATDGYGLIAEPGTTAGQSLVNLGSTLAVGTIYIVSATKGAIAPSADLTSSMYTTILGVAVSTSLLDFRPVVSNVIVPA